MKINAISLILIGTILSLLFLCGELKAATWGGEPAKKPECLAPFEASLLDSHGTPILFDAHGRPVELNRYGQPNILDEALQERVWNPPDVAAVNPGCFVAGTPVDTPQGPVPIETIQTGTEVYSYDAHRVLRTTSVVEGFSTRESEIFLLTLENGTFLEVTGGHPFYKPSLLRYVFAQDLEAGDELLYIHPETDRTERIGVVSIERTGRTQTVYNLEVAVHHNYFVRGVLVHNASF